MKLTKISKSIVIDKVASAINKSNDDLTKVELSFIRESTLYLLLKAIKDNQ